MHKPESIQENETLKFHWDLEIQMDHSISVRRLDSALINKEKTRHLVNFAVPTDDRMKMKERKNINKFLGFARAEKAADDEGVSDTN